MCGCMNIDIKVINNINEYRKSESPTLYIASQKPIADALKEKGEAVCILIKEEDDLSLFSDYKYFITEPVQYSGHLEKIYCHIKNLPFYPAENERITIREEKLSDLDAIYEMYSDESCQKYLESLPPKETINPNERFESVKTGYMINGYGMWIIEKKDTREIIGRVGFEDVPDKENCISLGYMIKESERKKGYAKEAALLAVNYIKSECDYLNIVAKCDPENVGSMRILEELSIPAFS